MVTPRSIVALIKSYAPRKVNRRQVIAAILLAALGAGSTWLLVNGYHLGPRITVQQPAVAGKLAEPAPLEKPAGSSTAPQERSAAGKLGQENASGTATESPQGRITGQAAPAALSRLSWPAEGRVIRGYGYGFVAAYQDYRFHPGIDLAAPVDMPVLAAADGQVKELAYDTEHRWQVVLEHGSGWETIYMELGRITDLAVGAWVKAGEPLGYLAEPGRAAESQVPHLHFELRYKGEARNPLEFLPPSPRPAGS